MSRVEEEGVAKLKGNVSPQVASGELRGKGVG